MLLPLLPQKTGDVRLQLQTMQQELEGARSDLASRVEKVEQQQQQMNTKKAALQEKVRKGLL